MRAATRASYRLLEPVPELSYGDADSENLLIQGDNLDALKALLPLNSPVPELGLALSMHDAEHLHFIPFE